MLKIVCLILSLTFSIYSLDLRIGATSSLTYNNISKSGAAAAPTLCIPATNGLKLGVKYVNEHIFPLTLDGIEYEKMTLVVEDDEYDDLVSREYYEEWLENDEFDFYLAPYTTISDPNRAPPETTITNLFEEAEKVFLSLYSPYSEFSNYPRQWAFSVGTTFEEYMRGTVIPYRFHKAKSAVYIKSRTSVQGMCNEELTDYLRKNGIEVVGTYNISDAGYNQYVPFEKYPKELLDNLTEIAHNVSRQYDPDIWYICSANAKIGIYMRHKMKQINYTPRAMVGICSDEIRDWEYPETHGFMTCITSYRTDAKFVDDGFGNVTTFINMYKEEFGEEPTSFAIHGALVVRILGETLKLARTTDQYTVRDFLRRYTTNSLKGKISWDANHRQSNTGFLMQANLTGHMHIIAPYETATTEHIYPEPEWFERKYDKNRYKNTEIAFIVVTVLCIALNVFWAVFVIIKRENKTIKAGSPIFLIIILVGSTIAYTYNFVVLPSLSDQVAMCHLKRWLLGVGFALLFNALLAKTWRVDRVFSTKSLEVFSITNLDVMKIVIFLTSTFVMWLVLISAFLPSNTIEIINEPNKPYYNNYVCPSKTVTKGFDGLLITNGILVIIAATILGIKVRQIPLNRYDESKVIGFSIYNGGFFGILLLIINNIDLSYINNYILTCSLLIVSNLITVNTLMFHKLQYLKNPNSSKSSDKSTPMESYNRSRDSFNESKA